jgi:hypothetical protein
MSTPVVNAPAPPASRPAPAPAAITPNTGGTRTNSSARPSGAPARDTGRRSKKANRRPPRLASLQLKRIDPWTVLKISLIVTIVMFFVWMIAVGVLYLSLGSMDVWTKINETYNTLATSDATAAGSDLITPARVFGITAVVGAINIVLFTALATIAAFVYNAAAGMAGGVELTLGERD